MDDTVTYGTWVRRRRRALDLTQAELAHRVGCAVTTIEKLEADARRPSKAMAERLADALELAPGARAGFLSDARRGWAGKLPDLVGPADRLPIERPRVSGVLPVQSTPLIGRAREVAAVCAALEDTPARLVTLTGPGGIGKTRIALQVAADLTTRFADGVVFVDLAPITDLDLIPASIAHALGAQDVDRQSLAADLRDKHLLLVLDNFEHVVAAAPLIADLLAAAPRLKVLLTSRVVVGVYGEQLVEVPPLAYPANTRLAPDTLGVQRALEYEAIRLFTERARAVKADFAVGHDNVAAVVAICSQLEGLPLALELAAARIRLLPPQTLLARLHPKDSQRLPLLTGGAQTLPLRQQTLRATIDWSYHLLDRHDQVLYRRLSVFVGGWSLEAAESVCQASEDLPGTVLDGLHSLLDKSLLQQRVSVDGEPRCTMMETIREYASEQLDASGEREMFQRRHAAYYLGLVEVPGAITHRQQPMRFTQVDTEHDNLRAALAWALAAEEPEIALRLAGALGQFWAAAGYLTEGRQWLGAALRLHGRPPEPAAGGAAHRAKVLIEAAWLAHRQADDGAARTLNEAALALYREVENALGMAVALCSLALGASRRGDSAAADELFATALALHTDHDAIVLHNMGLAKHLAGDHRGALRLLEASHRLLRERDPRDVKEALHTLGAVVLELGDDRRACAIFTEGLHAARQQGDTVAVVLYVRAFACLAAASVERSPQGAAAARRAARLLGAAETLGAAIDVPGVPAERALFDRHVAVAREKLDAAAWEAERAAGSMLPLEQAIAYALEMGEPAS